MRMILLATTAIVLASCATSNMRAGGPAGQEAANASQDEPRTPDVFRKPPRQFGKWGGYGYGERY